MRPSFARHALKARLHADARGHVLVEYLAVTFLLAIVIVATLAREIGPRVVDEYTKRRALVEAPTP